ncbi:MAG: 3,4-dihydroxyphenylacetate 2,3-dioxygenase [Achromobacter sp.]|uniref:3,4-dihydroxyphenylacetate 2,3-dioxygenase n=1 Tax=Achromobacter sp. TaxID=134375 RepID=UPI003CFFC4B9
MIDYAPGKPDFNILRLGHIEYLVSDLARARDFYVDVVGLFETESDADHVYLRAIEDREHHSVVLTRSPSPGIGHFSFRVSCEEDLERLAAKFKGLGLPIRWLEAGEERGQGRALRVQDPFGFPVEYYAHMDQAPWMLQQYHLHRHGCPTRLDHLNVLVPDAQAGFDWYTRELGFFCSEYTVSAPPEERVWASWLYRKATIHDIAVMTGKGPTVHHAGFSLMEPMGVIRACDALAAAGYADNIERGPARHGISNALFVYVRDPDGNRFELYTGDYLTVDRDQAPLRWELDNPRRQSLWGTPPPRRWYEESMSVASLVDGRPQPVSDPITRAIPTYVD